MSDFCRISFPLPSRFSWPSGPQLDRKWLNNELAKVNNTQWRPNLANNAASWIIHNKYNSKVGAPQWHIEKKKCTSGEGDEVRVECISGWLTSSGQEHPWWTKQGFWNEKRCNQSTTLIQTCPGKDAVPVHIYFRTLISFHSFNHLIWLRRGWTSDYYVLHSP